MSLMLLLLLLQAAPTHVVTVTTEKGHCVKTEKGGFTLVCSAFGILAVDGAEAEVMLWCGQRGSDENHCWRLEPGKWHPDKVDCKLVAVYPHIEPQSCLRLHDTTESTYALVLTGN